MNKTGTSTSGLRDVESILGFRADYSPFLTHLTRKVGKMTAREVLKKIIRERTLIPGTSLLSDVRHSGQLDPTAGDQSNFFSAICFTETPLAEIHSLLSISGRSVNLTYYGLVFLKKKLRKQGVDPVIYLNNINDDKHSLAAALLGLAKTHPEEAKKLLPLVAVAGELLRIPGKDDPIGRQQFQWEREWRRPKCLGNLPFGEEDVFVGLCPDSLTGEFEALFPGVDFVDPRMNVKWYAEKLIAARKRLDLKFSVV